MAQYTKTTNANGTTRYKESNKFVAATEVPDAVKEALSKAADGTVIDELGDVVDPSTDTDEGSGDDDEVQTNTPPAEDDSAVDEDGKEDDTDGDEGDDGENGEDPAPVEKPAHRAEVGNMGFPAAKGKTLSIFSNKPHETVKNVGGILVPLTMEELNGDPANGVEPKNDAEIIEELKKLGKI